MCDRRAQVPMQGGRQVYESKYMDRDEIDSILRIQWKSLHNGPPYQEDYYYQVNSLNFPPLQHISTVGPHKRRPWLSPLRPFLTFSGAFTL